MSSVQPHPQQGKRGGVAPADLALRSLSYSEYGDAGCVGLTCARPALEPFAHFALRVLDLQGDSLIGRIVEQAADLFLFRCDPDALRAMMEFWYGVKNYCENGS